MEATVSEQNPVATMLQYYKTANMSRLEPQLSELYGGKKREEPLAHMHVAKKTSATLTEGDCSANQELWPRCHQNVASKPLIFKNASIIEGLVSMDFWNNLIDCLITRPDRVG